MCIFIFNIYINFKNIYSINGNFLTTQEYYELFWTNSGSNTPRNNSCPATCLQSKKNPIKTNKTCVRLLENKDELISEHASVVWPARTYLYNQLLGLVVPYYTIHEKWQINIKINCRSECHDRLRLLWYTTSGIQFGILWIMAVLILGT